VVFPAFASITVARQQGDRTPFRFAIPGWTSLFQITKSHPDLATEFTEVTEILRALCVLCDKKSTRYFIFFLVPPFKLDL
jgi:hypothetical protein